MASALLALIWPAVAHAIEVWSTTEEFSFGFLVVPISVGLIASRRRDLWRQVQSGRGSPEGLAVVAGMLLAYLVAWRLAIHALAGIAVPPLLWGAVLYLWGRRAARLVAFPLAFLVFGFGLFRGLLDSVGFALQGITASGATTLAHVMGIGVVRDGFVLTSDRFAFVVAETCSGMSSLVSLLALAALWTALGRGPLSAKAAVVLSAIPLVVIANSTRVALVLFVANWFGQDAALGFFHGASSLVLFGIALVGLVLVSRMAGCNLPRTAS